MGKDSTLRRARTSLWWPGMNKQLKQFIDICEVYNAFQTKNQQFKSWVSYFFSGTLPGFSWRLRTCHRLAPGVGLLANQLQENMSGNPSQPATNRRGGGSLVEWLGAGLSIRRRRVQVPPWPPAGFVRGSPEFKSSTTLLNSQLVCLLPVGILNLLC